MLPACPLCGSRYPHKVQHLCGHPWHSPAVAPASDTPALPVDSDTPESHWLMKPALEWLEQAEHFHDNDRCKMIAAVLRDLWRDSLRLRAAEQERNKQRGLIVANIASAEFWRERAESAEAKLPDGMKNCTILFKECERGHGWLTATNWVQHGCPTCRAEVAEKEVARLNTWADGMSDTVLRERKAADALRKEVKQRADTAEHKVRDLIASNAALEAAKQAAEAKLRPEALRAVLMWIGAVNGSYLSALEIQTIIRAITGGKQV